MTDFDDENYVLGTTLIKKIVSVNSENNTGKEYRLQKIYGYELFKKIQMLNLDYSSWNDKTILDLCCGTGFVSYHLLDKIKPDKVILMDISKEEVNQAKKLLYNTYPTKNLSFTCGNAIMTGFKDNSFDIIIGNSFLHHFYSIPQAFKEFRRILKPGGIFISLHEPPVAAVALESGNLYVLIKYMLQGDKFIDTLRYSGQDIAPGKGQDVWIFNETRIQHVLEKSGFHKTFTSSFHLLRPFFVGKFALHLNKSKPHLSEKEIRILRLCIKTDIIFSKFLPTKYFGSFAIKGEKI